MSNDLPRIRFYDDDGRAASLPRMADWLIAAILLTLLVWLLAPHQLPVSVYKLSLIALAAVAGYWIDRRLFPYARPDMFLSVDEPPEIEEDAPEGGTLSLGTVADPVLARLMAAAMLRRAIIVAAAMIAVGLGA